jgi:hypothetical protein
MSGDQDVAGCGLKKRKTALETLDVFRILSEQESVGGDWREAVGINDIEAAVAFARHPSPTRSAGRMTWCEMSRQLELADSEGFTIVKRFDIGDRRDSGDDSVLRVIGRNSAFLQNRGTPSTGNDTRAALALQFGNASSVIEVNVRIDDQLYILDTKAERADVGDNLRGGFRQCGVDKNVTGGGSDEEGAQAVRAYVVGVAVQAKGRLRGIPGRAFRARRGFLCGRESRVKE